MDDPDLNADDLFLDAVDMIVLGALSRIGSDSEARFRFFRRLVELATDAAASSQRAGLDH